MKCPYCGSEDIVEWGNKLTQQGTFATLYRCYTCGKRFEEREIKGCGKQIFRYGDNYPVFNKGEKKMKFKRGNKVRIKMDTGIYYEGEILYYHPLKNLYKVKYNDGFRFTEDTFKEEELELMGDNISTSSNNIKTNCKSIARLAQKERIKFKDLEKVPKAKKDDLINLWIDLWELLRDKLNGKKINAK